MSNFQTAIEKLTSSPDKRLDRELIIALADDIFSGNLSSIQLASLLTAFRIQGETGNEVEPFVSSMLHHAETFPASDENEAVVDTCGTGGDGHHTFNISTTAAFITAAAGIKVAKHGNRSASSRCGSADVLQSLGLEIEQSAESAFKQLQETHFCFLFARSYHKSMRFAAEARQELKIRTLFNLCGPLSNPAKPNYQLVGVASADLMLPMIESLKLLGRKRALVVHGADGMDEISMSQDTHGLYLDERGHVDEWKLSPRNMDLKPVEMKEFVGGDAEENAEITKSILSGEKSARADITNLNAAAAIWLTGKEATLEQSFGLAKALQESGAGIEVLNKVLEFQKYDK